MLVDLVFPIAACDDLAPMPGRDHPRTREDTQLLFERFQKRSILLCITKKECCCHRITPRRYLLNGKLSHRLIIFPLKYASENMNTRANYHLFQAVHLFSSQSGEVCADASMYSAHLSKERRIVSLLIST